MLCPYHEISGHFEKLLAITIIILIEPINDYLHLTSSGERELTEGFI
jgi:hypothetical protein